MDVDQLQSLQTDPNILEAQSKMFGISAAHYRLTLSQASSMHCGFNQIEYLDRTRNRSRQIGGSLRHPVERRGPEVRSKRRCSQTPD